MMFALALLLASLSMTVSVRPCHAEEGKDRFQAFIMSFLVPGLGQYYTGAPGYAKLFIASELALWGGYFYNTAMKDASRNDYFSHAALHAGINPEGRGTSYLNAIGAYDSSYEYNQRRLQMSFNPVLYAGALSWEWDSPESRIRFKSLRERELDYENNVKFCIAGVVLNHFLSALHAAKHVRDMDHPQSAVSVRVLDQGLAATFQRRF